MNISFQLSALRSIKPHEYVVRFLFGGTITVATGLIARHYGPSFAGLFLAFPAIFPASVTLIEKHQTQKKQRVGLRGTRRGRLAASLDAMGTALGCIGLATFAVVVWQGLPRFPAWLVLIGALAMWMMVSFLAWSVRKKL